MSCHRGDSQRPNASHRRIGQSHGPGAVQELHPVGLGRSRQLLDGVNLTIDGGLPGRLRLTPLMPRQALGVGYFRQPSQMALDVFDAALSRCQNRRKGGDLMENAGTVLGRRRERLRLDRVTAVSEAQDGRLGLRASRRRRSAVRPEPGRE